MAQTDTDHQDDKQQPVWLSLLLLSVLLLIVAGAGYMLGDHRRQDAPADNSDEARMDHQATDDKPVAEKQSTATSDETQTSQDGQSYVYTAGEGESYTTMARRAVAATSSQLSPVERVAAETRLAQDAGAEMLAVGQKVAFDKSTVEAAVKWARSLSAEEKAAWQPYADMVAW